jgi:hypothetical protein
MEEELKADQMVTKPVKGTHPVDNMYNRVFDQRGLLGLMAKM